MTLSDAIFKGLLDVERFVERGPFARHATVLLIDRSGVCVHGDVGEVVSSDREYTQIRISGFPQIVRTSQLRGHRRAEVISQSY